MPNAQVHPGSFNVNAVFRLVGVLSHVASSKRGTDSVSEVLVGGSDLCL